MPLFTSTDYPEVRAAIDTTLTDKQLPDATIAFDIHHAAAESMVTDFHADALSETGDNLTRCKRAAILFCAALLCPSVVRLTSVNSQARGHSFSQQTFDPEEKAAELKARAYANLEEVVAPSETAQGRPTMFKAVSGQRGL